MLNREYFYFINARGEVIHDDCIIDDKHFLHLFYKNMQFNDSNKHSEYRYLSKCGSEMLFINVEDTPIVFTHIVDDSLVSAAGAYQFNPADLRHSTSGILYHRSQIGNYGRIAPALAMELSKHIKPWGPYFSFKSPDMKHSRIIELLQNDRLMYLHPREQNSCFGCGNGNPNGLGLTFIYDKQLNKVQSWLIPNDFMMGSLDIMHGGFVSLLLDEAMGKALSPLNIKAPTAQLNVRFKKPTYLGRELSLEGEIISIQGRKHFIKATLKNSEGEITAEADGLFIKIADKIPS